VRSATVAVAWTGGFVVAGRSLRLTEQHEDQIRSVVAFGWLLTLALVAVAALLVGAFAPPGRPAPATGPARRLRPAGEAGSP
jgi:hypothetical protein